MKDAKHISVRIAFYIRAATHRKQRKISLHVSDITLENEVFYASTASTSARNSSKAFPNGAHHREGVKRGKRTDFDADVGRQSLDDGSRKCFCIKLKPKPYPLRSENEQ